MVQSRNDVIESLEMDRLREAEEDQVRPVKISLNSHAENNNQFFSEHQRTT